MKVKGIGNRKYNAYKYIKLKLYLLSFESNSNIALINREFYIIDELTTKVLIDIDIIKLEGIVIDLDINIIKIGTYKNLLIPIDITSKGTRVNITIFSRKSIVLLLYTNVLVLFFFLLFYFYI